MITALGPDADDPLEGAASLGVPRLHFRVLRHRARVSLREELSGDTVGIRP